MSLLLKHKFLMTGLQEIEKRVEVPVEVVRTVEVVRVRSPVGRES